MTLIRIGGKALTVPGLDRSGLVSFSRRGHVTPLGEFQSSIRARNRRNRLRSNKLELNPLTQVHPSLRRSLSRVNDEVDCRLGDPELSRCGRLDPDNLVLPHFCPQLQHLLELGSPHLPPTRDLASGMVTLKRSRNEQVDSAVPAGSQIGIDTSNLFGEEFLR